MLMVLCSLQEQAAGEDLTHGRNRARTRDVRWFITRISALLHQVKCLQKSWILPENNHHSEETVRDKNRTSSQAVLASLCLRVSQKAAWPGPWLTAFSQLVFCPAAQRAGLERIKEVQIA